MTSLADRLLGHPLFASLPAGERKVIADESTLRQFKAHEVVFREGDGADGVRVLLSGSVRVFHTSPEGVEVAVKLFKAPGIFGEIEVVAGVPFAEDVAALEDCAIAVIPRQAFLSLLDRNPALTRMLLTHVCSCFCVAAHTEAAMSFDDVRSRLAHLLVGYAELYGTPLNGGGGPVRIRLLVTQDDMANALGVTRRAIAKEIARWQEAHVVERSAGRYVIRRLDLLAEESSPGRYPIAYVMGRALPPSP